MNRFKISSIAFYLAMICELVVSFSGYLTGGYNEKLIIFAGMGLSAFAIVLSYDYKSLITMKGIGTAVLYALAGAFGVICFLEQNSALVLRIAIHIIAARCICASSNENLLLAFHNGKLTKAKNITNEDATSSCLLRSNIVALFFYGTLIVMVTAAFLSAFGVGNPLSVTDLFRHVPETRYTFGFIHPNGFALFYIRLVLLGMYLYAEKIHKFALPVVMIIAVIPLIMCNSKMALAAYLIAVLMVMIARYIKNKSIDVFVFIAGILVLVVVAGFSYYVGPNFRELRAKSEMSNKILSTLNDEYMSGRMHSVYASFKDYTVKAFGYGNVLTTSENGFVNSLFSEGAVFCVIFMLCSFWLLMRFFREKNRYGMIFVMVMFAYNFAESFMAYFNKNIIWLMMI